MSVVIVGGNERMERDYKNLCKEYDCTAKVIMHMSSALKDIGRPDLLVLFTGTASHKMVSRALNCVKGQNVSVARCRTSSMSALRNVLDQHIGC